jgi:hypothetical protein
MWSGPQSKLLLASDRLDPCNVFPEAAQLLHALRLPELHLKAEPEELLCRLLLLMLELVCSQVAYLV